MQQNYQSYTRLPKLMSQGEKLIRCDRYIRRGPQAGQCKNTFKSNETEKGRKQQFCKEHRRYCREAYEKYKKIEEDMKTYVVKHCISKNYNGNTGFFTEEHLWGFSIRMIDKLSKMAKDIIRLRKAYASLCTTGEGLDPGHSQYIEQVRQVLKVISKKKDPGIKMPDLVTLENEGRNESIIKEIKNLLKGNKVIRTRNSAEYEILKEYYKKVRKRLNNEHRIKLNRERLKDLKRQKRDSRQRDEDQVNNDDWGQDTGWGDD